MANFVNKITEMQYNSISDFVTHYLEDVREGVYVTIYADWENAGKLISALSPIVQPVSIEYGKPGVISYDKEYCVSVVEFVDRDEELFVEFTYNTDRNSYLNDIGIGDVAIIIGEVSDEFMQIVEENCNNIVKVSF